MNTLLRFCLLGCCLLMSVGAAQATSLDELNAQVKAFEDSGQARYAPAAMRKITAYQGAAMLAAEQDSAFAENNGDNPNLQRAIDKALQVLKEAQNTAKMFTATYADLLALEKEADKAYVYHHPPRMLAEPEVEKYYQDGKTAMKITIVATEQGKLNQARQAADDAKASFNRCIDAAMPGLVEQSDEALSQASGSGASRLAPRTWHEAKDALEKLEAYLDDLQRPQAKRQGVARPARIGYALETAVYAQKLAIHAKALARDTGSYEKLMLQSRREHLDFAQALHMEADYDEVGLDIEPKAILQAIQDLYAKLEEHENTIRHMQETYDNKLASELAAQQQRDHQACLDKLQQLKSAYSSRLEQETFESKRQKKLRSLFKPGEVDVITKLDGSLIIRAKKIRFEPNSSKVDGKYFAFLGRIKEALELYPDRRVRIEGHTDSTGDATVNRKLSLKRAEAVRDFLIAAGMDAGKLRAVGFGEAKPIASNMYKKGRAMNRRIDIVIEAPHG